MSTKRTKDEIIAEQASQIDTFKNLVGAAQSVNEDYSKMFEKQQADLAAAQARIVALEAELAQAMEIMHILESLDLLSAGISELREVGDIQGYIDIHVFREEKLKNSTAQAPAPQPAQAVTLSASDAVPMSEATHRTLFTSEIEWLARRMRDDSFFYEAEQSQIVGKHFLQQDTSYSGYEYRFVLAPEYNTPANCFAIVTRRQELGLGE